jgi:hypothetical protein
MNTTLKIGLGALLVALSATSMAEVSRQERMDEALNNYRNQNDKTDTSRLERAGDKVEHGAKKTGHAVKRGAKKTEAAVGRGMEKTGNAMERTGDKMQNNANKADH